METSAFVVVGQSFSLLTREGQTKVDPSTNALFWAFLLVRTIPSLYVCYDFALFRKCYTLNLVKYLSFALARFQIHVSFRSVVQGKGRVHGDLEFACLQPVENFASPPHQFFAIDSVV